MIPIIQDPQTRFFGKKLDNLPVPTQTLKFSTPALKKPSNDPRFVLAYQDEILYFLLDKPNPIRDPLYMKTTQKDINGKMRGILVDWLISVQYKFELSNRTIFLAISILDRYLEKVPIPRQKLQLLGLGSLVISSKIEEVFYPEIGDFSSISDFSFSKDEIIAMEESILSVLGFDFNETSTLEIFQFCARKMDFGEKWIEFGTYVLELCLVEYETLKYTKGLLAISTAFLTRCVLGGGTKHRRENVESVIYQKCGIGKQDVLNCAKELLFMINNQRKSKLQAVQHKHRALLSELGSLKSEISL